MRSIVRGTWRAVRLLVRLAAAVALGWALVVGIREAWRLFTGEGRVTFEPNGRRRGLDLAEAWAIADELTGARRDPRPRWVSRAELEATRAALLQGRAEGETFDGRLAVDSAAAGGGPRARAAGGDHDGMD